MADPTKSLYLARKIDEFAGGKEAFIKTAVDIGGYKMPSTAFLVTNVITKSLRVKVAYDNDGITGATKETGIAACGVAGTYGGYSLAGKSAVVLTGKSLAIMKGVGAFVGAKGAEMVCERAIEFGEKVLSDVNDLAIGLSADQTGYLDSWDPRKQQTSGTESKISDNGEDAGFVAENQSNLSDIADNPTQEGGPSRPLSSSCSYTIKSGDTLGEIAERSGTTVDKLMEANPQLTDKNKIFADQKINLPEADSVPPGADLGLYGDVPVDPPPTKAPEGSSLGEIIQTSAVDLSGDLPNDLLASVGEYDFTGDIQGYEDVATDALTSQEEILLRKQQESEKEKSPAGEQSGEGSSNKTEAEMGSTSQEEGIQETAEKVVAAGEEQGNGIDFSHVTLEGTLNAGGQAWIDALAADQGWSDLERFSAKVAINTVVTSSPAKSAAGIGYDMATDAAWNMVGEQLGLTTEEIGQARAGYTVLTNLSTPTKIGLDTAFTALGLDDEIGSTAVANDIVAAKSSDASTLGMVGGAIGSYVGSVVPVVGTYLGNIAGTAIGNAVGNAVFGESDTNPKSMAKVVFNETTGEFEIESSKGQDGMDGSTGESLAQSVLDTLNGKGDQPGIIDQMTGENGQVANGRYIPSFRIGFNDGKYQLGGEKFKNVETMIEKATIKMAQSVLVEDGNPFVQQAVYESDTEGGLTCLMNNIQTASQYQTLTQNEEGLQSLRYETLSGGAHSSEFSTENIKDQIGLVESDIDHLREKVADLKTTERNLADKQSELEDLRETLADKLEELTQNDVDIENNPFIDESSLNDLLTSVANLEDTVLSLEERQTIISEKLEQSDDKLSAIAEYREAIAENKAAAEELKELNEFVPGPDDKLSFNGINDAMEQAQKHGYESLDEARGRSAELNEIISENTETANHLMKEGGDNFYLEATDWNQIRVEGFALNLDESDKHTSTSRLNITLENELDLDLDSVTIKDLMLEVNQDGTLDIGFRTDGEDATADVDNLTHKVHIDNWKEWPDNSSLEFQNGKSYDIKPLIEHLGEANADNDIQLDMKAKIEEIWGEDADLDSIDFFFGGDGDDVIVTGDTDDLIDAGEGDNTIHAGDGDNYIEAGDGDNQISAGDGDDQVVLGNGNNIVNVGDGDNTVKAGDGDNTIIAGDGDDTITLGDGNNIVNAGVGDNTVTVGDGTNQVFSGDGDDSITVGDGDNIINAGDGNNVISAGDGANTIISGDGDDEITAGSGDQQIFACDGNNRINTGTGDSTIASGDGDDQIRTGDGNQTIQAGDGNNIIETGTGESTVSTGSGDDRVSLGEGDQWVSAGDGDNTVLLKDGDSQVLTGTGDDTIIAGDGDQVIQAGDGDNRVELGLGDSIVQTGDGDDTILVGDGDQALYAGDGDNTIEAGHGDSTVVTGDGDDEIVLEGGDHHIEAGDGNNTIKTGHGDNTVVTGSGDDQISTGDGNQEIYAGDGDNTITAGEGNSIVVSGDGNDTILLGDGDQIVQAGDGNNSIVSGDGDSSISTGSGDDQVELGTGDQIVFAGDGDNTIKAGHGDHTIVTGSGDDQIILKDGDRTVQAGDGENIIVAGDGNSQVSTGAGNDRIDLGDGDHTIQTGSGDDHIITGDGDQTIISDGGDNTIQTGDGEQTIVTGSGADKVSTGSGDDRIVAGDGNNIIDSGSGDDKVLTGSGEDKILTGDGDDSISAGGGADEIDGGQGVDMVTYRDSTEGITVDLETGSGTGGDAAGDTLRNIENIEGSSADDTITGDSKENIIDGGEGDDHLTGGLGADHIIGGEGNDSVSFDYMETVSQGESMDEKGVDVSLGGGSDIGFNRSEGDILDSVENVTGSALDDRLQGNLEDNFMEGGAGNDTLYGLDGDDVLSGQSGDDLIYGGEGSDILSGGEGNDVLFGEAGDDLFMAGAGDDLIVGGEGEDTFLAEKAIENFEFAKAGEGLRIRDLETGDVTTVREVEQFQFGDQAFHVNQIFDLTAPIGFDCMSFVYPEEESLEVPDPYMHPRKRAEDKNSAGIQAVQLSMAAAFGIALTTIPTAVAAENADGTMGTESDTIFSLFNRPLAYHDTNPFTVHTTPTNQAPAMAVPADAVTADMIPAGDLPLDYSSMEDGSPTVPNSETGDTLGADSEDAGLTSDLSTDTDQNAEDDSGQPVFTEGETGGRTSDITENGLDTTITVTGTVSSEESPAEADLDTSPFDDGPLSIAASKPELSLAGSEIAADGQLEAVGTSADEILVGDIEDVRIRLDLSAALSTENLNDGDTTLKVSVVLPEGVVLSQGVYQEETGSWLLTEEDLADLEMIVPVGMENVEIAVQSIAEKNGVVTYGDVQNLDFEISGAGNDTIDGQGGDDEISGGLGDDILTGGTGADILDGGEGDDTLIVDGDDTYIDGGEGTDTAWLEEDEDGELEFDTGVLNNVENLMGSDGNDVIDDSTQADVDIDAGDGDDTLSYEMAGEGVTVDLDDAFSDDGDSTLRNQTACEGARVDLDDDIPEDGARVGFETLIGSSHDDDLSGDRENDTIQGGAGHDLISGEGGNDELLGGEGNDAILGGEGDDRLNGGIGSDILAGGSGSDLMEGGDGSDVLDGGDGIDKLLGGAENDLLTGGAGDDTLMGGSGADTLEGGQGDDTLIVDEDDISVDGGDGEDTVFLEQDSDGAFEFDTGVLSDVEKLVGSGGNDIISDSELADVAIDAGEGEDTLSYETADEGVTMDLADSIAEDGARAGFERLIGSGYNDDLGGDSESNMIQGGAGHDRISGEAGNDELLGGEGNDTILGGEGDDQLSGGSGNDILAGGSGSDLMEGGDGSDILDGGDGIDMLLGGADSDVLTGGAGDDTLMGGSGADTLEGGQGDDTLIVDEDDISVDGGDGEDTVFLEQDSDGAFEFDTGVLSDVEKLVGSGGNDIISDSELADVAIDAGEGEDTLSYETADEGVTVDLDDSNAEDGDRVGFETLIGSSHDDDLSGDSENDTIYGGVGHDLISGEGGNDELLGGDGNDAILGGEGDDRLNGGTGSDILAGGSGSDLMEGGDGSDTLDGGEGMDMLLGGADSDVLTGGAGDDSLMGGDGSDLLAGGEGDDVLVFDDSDFSVDGGDGHDIAVLNESQGGQTVDTRLVHDIEHIQLSTQDDTVLIDQTNDYVLDGGDGRDVLDGTGATALDIQLSDTVDSPSAIVNIEEVIGSGFDDQISGNSQDDFIQAGAGDDVVAGGGGDDLLSGDSGADTLTGGAGNDSIFGGTGADILDGGAGDDQLSFDADDTFITGGAGDDLAVLSGSSGQPIQSDRFSDVEHIRLGDADDTFKIHENNEYTLEGMGGDDVIDGSEASEGLDLALSDTPTGDNYITGFDSITGSGHDDQFTGNSGDNILSGAAGDDLLEGGVGDDELHGDAGQDSLSGGAGDDLLFFDADDIQVQGGSGEDRAILQGSTPGQAIRSDAISQVEHVELSDGDDRFQIMSNNDYTLDGSGGNNVLDGGLAGQGLDLSLSDTAEGASFIYGFDEVVGSGHDDSLNGNSFGNTIGGGAGADLIHGGQGTDLLSGGDGNDVLHGDGGVDTLSGGAGNDQLHFEVGDSFVDGGEGMDRAVLSNTYDNAVIDTNMFAGVEHFELGGAAERFKLYETNSDYSIAAGGGYDRIDASGAGSGVDLTLTDAAAGSTYITGVEEVIGSGYADNIAGDSGADTLRGGGGNDVVSGGSGNDTLYGNAGNDTINGGAGADNLSGGTGNDTLFFDADDLSVNGGSGTDTAILATSGNGTVIAGSRISNVEHVKLGNASETIQLQGSNSYSIDGGSGHDTIDGSNAGSSLNLSLSDSAGGGNYITRVEEIVGSGFNDSLTGNSSNNTLSGGAGNDTLSGGAGSDTLVGGGGNDTLYFDGSDSLNGGAGTDTAIAENTGSGVSLSGNFFNGIEAVQLTGYNDRITLTNGYGFTVNGGSGQDHVNGSGSSSALNIGSIRNVEQITGSSYNDTLRGDGTNTTYTGGLGNDTIIGGGGIDTARYSANLSDVIQEMKTGGNAYIQVDAGEIRVRTDVDGRDTLQQVERLQFADQTINLTSNVPPYAVSETLDAGGFVRDGVDLINPRPNDTDYITISKSYFLTNDFDINLNDTVTDLQVTDFQSDISCIDMGDYLEIRSNSWTWGGIENLDRIYDELPEELSFSYRVIDSNGALGETATATLTGIEPVATPVPPPLIFDLDGGGAEIVNSIHSGVLFDIDSDGEKETMTAWAGENDGFLAYDVDGDGVIDRGEEIVLADYHPDAKTDLEGLALAFDSNGDGSFDNADEEWGRFGIWRDGNQDGVCDEGEFKCLNETDIASIGLTSDEQPYEIENGYVYGTGTYTKTDGSESTFADAALGYQEDEFVNGSPGAYSEQSTESTEYEQFLAEYQSEVDAIQSDLQTALTESDLQFSEQMNTAYVAISDEIAAVHRTYNEEVLLPEQSEIQVDESLGPVDMFIDIDGLSELWLTVPDPDFA